MALHLFGVLSVTAIFLLLGSINGAEVISDGSDRATRYTVENGRSDGIRPEMVLLERQRRYVAGNGPLDEYIHPHDKQLVNDNTHNDRLLPDSLPGSSRQTKEMKLTEVKALLPVVTDNSSTRQTAPTSTSTSTAASPALSANSSVIISAGLYDGTTNRKDDDDITIDNETDTILNRTMTENNVTQKQEDHHVYYNSTFLVDHKVGQAYWVNMNLKDNVRINHMLSKSHRRAATIKLSFDFPFYGHMVRNVTVATGGFLYTGEYVHSWLAATQYIAPLMANFDTSISNDSYIKYIDNGTAFTVQWDRVVLQDKPLVGEFTFQATLHSNGDIVFVYQNVPIIIEDIQDNQHPVKVGLSDAYIIDRTIFFIRRKTIYEYHRVNFNKEDIKNWTVIYLSALPTCLGMKDCHSCLQANIGFECKWCTKMGRCSTGVDRLRQDWLNQCGQMTASTADQCEEHSQSAAIHTASPHSESEGEEVRTGGSGYLGATFVVVLIAGVAIWAIYAYSNPHSTSGQILIRYRPSQWSWRRREAGYTAATIHM